jgi:hypothetical protein
VAPPIVHEVLRAPGRPLEPAVRSTMESRFGHDFGRVRVHADARAAESARQVGALAYTVGRNVVFGAGQLATGSASGIRLLAHELTHVVQQSGASSAAGGHPLPIDPSPAAERDARRMADEGSLLAAPALQRSPLSLQRSTRSPGGQCGGGSCAQTDACANPDHQGSGGTSSSWTLIAFLDIDRTSFADALLNQEFGHAFVKLMDGTGTEYTYGFYPASAIPNEAQPEVPGCVHHPDTSHQACVDEQVMYSLSQAQYNAALARAQSECRAPRAYHAASFNCTSFVGEVVRAAGQSLPPMRGTETVFYQRITADNPNTLLDNVRAERQRAPSQRFPFWNNPCFNRCEANFNSCVAASTSPMSCIAVRGACLRTCPLPR